MKFCEGSIPSAKISMIACFKQSILRLTTPVTKWTNVLTASIMSRSCSCLTSDCSFPGIILLAKSSWSACYWRLRGVTLWRKTSWLLAVCMQVNWRTHLLAFSYLQPRQRAKTKNSYCLLPIFFCSWTYLLIPGVALA